MADRVVAVITTHNEAETIGELISGLMEVGVRHVVVVDEGSTDGTCKYALQARATIVRYKGGIGPCLLEGMRIASLLGADRVLTVDAGGSHSPDEAKLLMDAPGDIVVGSRFIPGGSHDGPWYRRMGSRLYAHLWNTYYPNGPSDWTSGYRLYGVEAVGLLDREYRCRMHGWQAEVLSEAIQLDLTIVEVPITYTSGKSSLSPKIAWEALRCWVGRWPR